MATRARPKRPCRGLRRQPCASPLSTPQSIPRAAYAATHGARAENAHRGLIHGDSTPLKATCIIRAERLIFELRHFQRIYKEHHIIAQVLISEQSTQSLTKKSIAIRNYRIMISRSIIIQLVCKENRFQAEILSIETIRRHTLTVTLSRDIYHRR